MRSCDACKKEITALSGHVDIRTDNWGNKVRPDVSKEFCSWPCLLRWVDKYREEVLVATKKRIISIEEEA